MAYTPRTKKTLQERVAVIDDKVAFHTRHITLLLQKKERLMAPRKQRLSYGKVFAALKKSGLSPEEILRLSER